MKTLLKQSRKDVHGARSWLEGLPSRYHCHLSVEGPGTFLRNTEGNAPWSQS